MRAIVRTLNTGGSKEQTMRPRTLHARLTTNLRVRSAIYQLAVESGSMEFVEYAYSKNWLMDPFTYARLKLRFRRLEFNSDSELAAM